MTYHLNVDFAVNFTYEMSTETTLKIGMNVLPDGKQVHVKSVPTLYKGICYVLDIPFKLFRSKYIGLRVIELQNHGNEPNETNGIAMYFTAKSLWDRVVFARWVDVDPYAKWFDIGKRAFEFFEKFDSFIFLYTF